MHSKRDPYVEVYMYISICIYASTYDSLYVTNIYIYIYIYNVCILCTLMYNMYIYNDTYMI